MAGRIDIPRLALRTLEDALAEVQASQGPIRRTWGHRLALAWLMSQSVADAWQCREFWHHLADPADWAHTPGIGQYVRSTTLHGLLNNWHVRLGFTPPDPIKRAQWAAQFGSTVDSSSNCRNADVVCNLYRLRAPANQIAETFGANPNAETPLVHEKDYTAPGKPGFVVRTVEGRRVLDIMLWGFPFNGKPVTNVRNYTSPFWKSALANPDRRCLVPATEFQEWSVEPLPDTGKRKAYWFAVPSQPIFAFAGIWRPTESDPVFSFLTCGYDGDPANHIVGAVHPKACPVILHPEDYDRWLHTDLDDAISLAAPYPSQLMAVT